MTEQDRELRRPEAPGPVIWAFALVVPLFEFSPHPADWLYWILAAAAWYVIGDWLIKRARFSRAAAALAPVNESTQPKETP